MSDERHVRSVNDAYYFLTFLVGVALLLATFALGIGAMKYEMISQGEVDGPPEGRGWSPRSPRRGSRTTPSAS